MTNYFLEETEQLNFGRNGTEGRGVVPGAGEVSEICFWSWTVLASPCQCRMMGELAFLAILPARDMLIS